TIFLIVSSGSPLALIASSLRSTSKKPVCPMTRSFHPPMTAHGHRVRFVATWREEFFEVPEYDSQQMPPADNQKQAVTPANWCLLGERFNFGRAGVRKSPAEAGLPSGRKTPSQKGPAFAS